MWLRRVRLQGFKAYKDETVVNFHRGSNAIVGLNGSGKSSLLEAITLVVSEVYGRRVIDPKSVFHHGVRNRSLSAFVELVFDNTDRKLTAYPTDEVCVCRTFTSNKDAAKKDQFTVAGKKVTKGDFAAVLEAGGFSRANPYYVIRQGKIMEMATMSDEGRLKLLKDFSGVQIYEEKRTQALETLEQARQKTQNSDVIVANLTKRLEELELQQRELREYEDLVRSADVIRMVVAEVELEGATEELVTLSKTLQNSKDQRQRLQNDIANHAGILSQLNDALKEASSAHDVAQSREEECKAAFQRAEIDCAEVEGSLEKLLLSRRLNTETHGRAVETANVADQCIREKQERLESVTEPALHEAQVEAAALKQKLSEVRLRHTELSEKQQRCKSFRSVTTRNKHLSAEIKKIEEEIKRLRTEESSCKDQIKKSELELKQLGDANRSEQTIDKLDEEERRLHDRQRELHTQIERLKSTETQLGERLLAARNANVRKVALDALDALSRVCRHATWAGNTVALRRGFDVSSRATDVDVYAQMATNAKLWRDKNISVRDYSVRCEEVGLPPVLGPIFGLIEVSDRCRKAVSQALGVQCENLVVWSDEIASSLYEDIKRNQASATITPLNQVAARSVNHQPPSLSNARVANDPNATFDGYDAVPLATVMSFPPFLEPVVKAVSGKWLLVRDLDTGHRISGSSEYDCVTLDGDKVTSRGALQGGHLSEQDPFVMFKHFCAVAMDAESQHARLNELEAAYNAQKEERTQCLIEQRKVLADRDRIGNEKAMLTRQRASQARVREVTGNRIKSLQTQAQELSDRIGGAQLKIADFRRLLLSNEMEAMGDKELAEIEPLTEEVNSLEQKFKVANRKVQELEAERNILLEEINHLRTELDESRQRIESVAPTEYTDDEKELRSRLVDLEKRKEEAEAARNEAAGLARGAEKSKQEILAEIEKHQEQLDDLSQHLERMQTEIELGERRRVEIEESRDQHYEARSGVFVSAGHTDAEIEALKRQSLPKLKKKLAAAESKLAEAPRVNMKALADLVTFQDELKRTTEKRQELLEGLDSIQKLMTALDDRRSRTLRHAFDQVNMNLQTVFSSIVPGGRAKLVIKKLSAEKIAALREARLAALESQTNEPPESAASGGENSASQAWKLEIQHNNKVASITDVLHWDEVASGIEVRASFRHAGDPGSAVEYFPLMALSGGQKTILALSLIFAMQRCDKAPFYILDEADAALDEAYRSAVGRLIQQTSRTSQFLITTFRRELCEICDRHFHVTNTDRVASIAECSKEDAIAVILEDAEQPTPAQALMDGASDSPLSRA